MKRFWIGSAIAMILIVAFGLTMNEIAKVKKCKDYLICIGDSYASYCFYKDEYQNEDDSNSEHAQNLKESAKQNASDTLYLIRFMEERNNPDLIKRCMSKLSLAEMKNLDAAFEYYEENADFVYQAYGTPEPQQ